MYQQGMKYKQKWFKKSQIWSKIWTKYFSL